jgi:predicted nucleic-acid-binding protein
MKGIDTNVLIRLFAKDDAKQSPRVLQLIERHERTGERLFVSVPVICELVWTLANKRYGWDRSGIAEAISRLLDTSIFHIQERESVRESLADFGTGNSSFADHLIGRLGYHAGADHTYTFDEDLFDQALFKPV